MVKLVTCSFINRCKNKGKMCDECKWNADINLVDHLLIETEDGKTLKFI